MKVAKSVPEIQPAGLPNCKSNKLLLPKVARRFASLGSTNAALLQALADGEPVHSGDVFVTEAQTAGRGQAGRRWHATPGDNLTLSLLFRPAHLSVSGIFSLTEATALAVADVLRNYLPEAAAKEVRIKWPNDVYIGDRKAAGILIQNGLRGDSVQWSVIGVGLNVNERDFPAELRDTAVALIDFVPHSLDREDVLENLLAALGERLGRLDAGGNLREEYLDVLYLSGREHEFRRNSDGRRFRATVTGVDVGGQLLLTHPDGRREAFALHGVSYR